MVDRNIHGTSPSSSDSSWDDELAERRLATAALPLEWDGGDDEDEDDDGPDATTIDLTERASRDDLAAWSDVLRRAPEQMARITTHPSAAGERLRAARAQQQQQLAQNRPVVPENATEVDELDDDDEFAQALTGPRRRSLRARRWRTTAPEREGADPVTRREPEGGHEGHEPSRRPRIGADLRSRVVTGVAVGAVALAFLAAGTGPAAFLCSVIIGLGVVELCAALRSPAARPAVIPALAGSVALVLGTYNNGLSAYAGVTALVVLGSLLWYMFQVVPSPPVMGMATTLFAFGYVGGLGGFAGLILGFSDGVGILLGLVLCVVANDITAYFAGRRFGRRPLTALSPKKTIEGLGAGMAGCVVVGLVVGGALAPWDLGTGLALGVVVAVMAPLGDICESMIKRDLGVKDLGGLLPGHGGVLDRFDAILFCLPAVYYLVRVFDVA